MTTAAKEVRNIISKTNAIDAKIFVKKCIICFDELQSRVFQLQKKPVNKVKIPTWLDKPKKHK